MRIGIVAGALLLTVLPRMGNAQDRPPQWERRTAPSAVPVAVFHSPQSANLPTAETVRAGEWQFEISHRFFPTLSSGAEDLWGLDGPVINRLGLAYGIVDRAMLTLQRSNLSDNLDLNLKLGAFEARGDQIDVMIAAVAGLAWNSDVPNRDDFDSRNFQYYGMAILNVLLADRLAVGVNPAYLRNPVIDAPDAENAISVGLYGQAYVTAHFSLLGEWNLSESRVGYERDAGTFGIELETGGHFFKLVLTNSTQMNPTQYLAGTPFAFEPDEWRLGFNVTRLLRF